MTNTECSKSVEPLIKELYDYAVEIRGNWADFDGREQLEFIDIWLAKLSKVLGLDYHSYYESYWPGAYKNQMLRFNEALSTLGGKC